MDKVGPEPAAAEPGVFGAAIQGQRSEQQDSFRSVWLADEQAWLLVVADGMGGHAAGAVASRIAVDTFVATFAGRQAGDSTLKHALEAALQAANSAIARGQEEAPETFGMGTTLVAAHVSADGLAWISVGDSPMWIFRRGAINRINDDHSFRMAAKQGAKVAANMLQSVLNGQQIALIDCQTKAFRMHRGDFVVLASDGLLTLSDREISGTIRESCSNGAEAVTRALLNAVEARGKSNQDNCTVLVAAPCGGGAETAMDVAAAGYRRIAFITLAIVTLAALVGFYVWRPL